MAMKAIPAYTVSPVSHQTANATIAAGKTKKSTFAMTMMSIMPIMTSPSKASRPSTPKEPKKREVKTMVVSNSGRQNLSVMFDGYFSRWAKLSRAWV